jgi:hypothetical protein
MQGLAKKSVQSFNDRLRQELVGVCVAQELSRNALGNESRSRRVLGSVEGRCLEDRLWHVRER